ncbi:MAG: HNH endonuclease [Deltaproteobacteria bacterium]|nr:MAG: HNH endonuclease [Deltaproteobacteria bacterium]RLA99588.1 MAG: HNH endonuclease [Deltaproteobacteria bacterium]
MQYTLLLNATYEPLRVISWKKAVVLVILGKVEVIEEYDREIRSVSFSIKLPSVVRLLRYVRRGGAEVKFSRRNIYARDGYRCQYCGRQFPYDELTCDHVIPRSRGGRTEWTNVVTCCRECNHRKGGRTPEEAGMRLLRQPKRPAWLPFIRITIRMKNPPRSWLDYFYWNVEVEREGARDREGVAL